MANEGDPTIMQILATITSFEELEGFIAQLRNQPEGTVKPVSAADWGLIANKKVNMQIALQTRGGSRK